MQNHRGMTIVELVSAIAVTALLLAIATTLFAAMLRLDRSFRRSTADRAEAQRLAAYFRRDAHEATRAEMADDGRSCTFVLPDGRRIDYVLKTDEVRRVEARAEDASNIERRQVIGLVNAADAFVKQTSISDHALIQLTVGGSDGTVRAGALPFHVEAELRGLKE